MQWTASPCPVSSYLILLRILPPASAGLKLHDECSLQLLLLVWMVFCSVATLDHNLQFVQRNYEFSSVGFCAGDIMLPGTNSLALKTMTIILVVVVGRPAVCEASTLGANVMQYKNGKRKGKNTTGRGETESRWGRKSAMCLGIKGNAHFQVVCLCASHNCRQVSVGVRCSLLLLSLSSV